MYISILSRIVIVIVIGTLTSSAFGQQESRDDQIQVSLPRFGSGLLRRPDSTTIKDISIQIFPEADIFRGIGENSDEEFAINSMHFEKVAAELFEGGEVDTIINPHAIEVGLVTIVYRSGGREHIPLYWGLGKSPLNYSFRGVRCRQSAARLRSLFPKDVDGDGTTRFLNILRDCKTK